jgi:CDP-diacylglycerol--glycerol-3-phosphate 3-phosphatidyltransferase
VRGLYAAKPWFTRQLNRIVTAAVARGWSPDAFTVAGILFAAVAAVGLIVGLWPIVLVGLVGRMAGANLDGAVARARGVSRPVGFVLNEIGDRVSDLLPLAALAYLAFHSGSLVALALGLIALTAASWPTFISLAIAGAGGRRINGGPFGKTERALVVLVAAVALTYLPAAITPSVTLSITSLVIIAGSILTAITRAVVGSCALRRAE